MERATVRHLVEQAAKPKDEVNANLLVRAPLAAEQPGAEMLFQLADARRHIELNAVGCTDDPALVNDGSEDLQGLQVDRSHDENDISELFICASRSAGPYSAA